MDNKGAADGEEEKKEGTVSGMTQRKEDLDTPQEKADNERVKRMTSFLAVMAKAAQFALNSQSWLQLISIIVYVWNAFAYDLTNPLELTSLMQGEEGESQAWHSVIILAECSLFLLEHLKKGGKLRILAGREID
jgi:hypothetical protein